MPNPEAPKSRPKIKSDFDQNPEFEEIMDGLLELDALDAEYGELGTELRKIRESAVDQLLGIGDRLKELSGEWGDDADFQRLQMVYEDLLQDSKTGMFTKLDVGSSCSEIGRSLRAEIDARGVKKVARENLSDELQEQVSRLDSIGINVEYVVPAERPKKAPTVILFLQVHADSDGDLSEEGSRSQITITRDLSSLLNSYTDTDIDAYVEGIPTDKSRAEILSSSANDNTSVIRDDENLHLFGMESPAMAHAADGKHLFKRPAWQDFRVILGNMLCARNIVKNMKTRGADMAVATMGAAHEGWDKDVNENTDEESFVDFSEALALEGVNVIVVDTTSDTTFDMAYNYVSKASFVMSPELSDMLQGVEEIGRVTSAMRELEEAVLRKRYTKLVDDVNNGRSLAYNNSPVPSYDDWFQIQFSKYLRLTADRNLNTSEKEEVLDAVVRIEEGHVPNEFLPENLFPESPLRVEYSCYVWKANKDGSDHVDYEFWLKEQRDALDD